MDELFEKLPNLNRKITFTNQTLNSFYDTLTTKKDIIYKDKINAQIKYFHTVPPCLKIPDSQYISNNIKNTIFNTGFYYKNVVFSTKRKQFTIHLCFPNSSRALVDVMNQYFDECFIKIKLWILFIQDHIKDKCSVKSNIFLFFTDHKKILGKKDGVLMPEHVNSAFTTSCRPETTIFIFRKEEWFKVFIHETFHCYGLDFSHANNVTVEDAITKHFKVINPNGIRLYESYCEVWAETMNVVFTSFFRTTTKKNFLSLFDYLMNKELSFSCFQVGKMMEYHKLNYEDLVIHKTNTIRLKENVHMLSYYVLKTVLMFNLKGFEVWCKKNNHTLFRFDENNALRFAKYIIELSRNPELINAIKRMRTFSKKAKLLKCVRITTRMSIVE